MATSGYYVEQEQRQQISAVNVNRCDWSDLITQQGLVCPAIFCFVNTERNFTLSMKQLTVLSDGSTLTYLAFFKS